MFQGYYDLTSNMITQNRNLNVVSNNMTNVSTPGYKMDRIMQSTFRDEMIYRYDRDGKTAVGMVSEYFLHDMDLSGENDFQIHIRGDRIDDGIKGKWNFSFKADGSLLLADTKRTAIGKTFELPNGGTITLDEFTSNELEQRISYSLSEGSDYLFKVEAEDSNGNQAEFDVRIQDKDSGHMQNQEILEDGRLNGEAGLVTMTLYAVEMPKESGRMSEDYIQIGEPFTIELP